MFTYFDVAKKKKLQMEFNSLLASDYLLHFTSINNQFWLYWLCKGDVNFNHFYRVECLICFSNSNFLHVIFTGYFDV